MDTYEQRFAAYDAECREKYSDKDREEMAKSGEAMPDGSYPIRDQEDLDNAIHAVGRGNASHDAIRRHIIKRAKALGHSDMIPDNWNTDGSEKQENAANPALVKAAERRRKERHRAVALSREYRFRQIPEMEVRREARDDTDIIILRGSAIVYDQPYTVVDMFGEFEERMHAGCVSNLLARGVDCRYLHNHGGMALGRTTSGTLELIDGPRSLDVVVYLDARQQLANDLAVAVERGDENQMSVGMIVGRDAWGDNGTMETRDVFELSELLDVSQVTYPASPTTHLEIAKRMAVVMPLATRARLRQMEVELRAGKVLSADSQSKLVAALTALHELAAAGQVDLNALGDPVDDDPLDVGPESDGTGDDAGESQTDDGIVYVDGSGARSDEETVEHREGMSSETFRFLVEAGRPRH